EAARSLSDLRSIPYALHGLAVAAEACKLVGDAAVATDLLQRLEIRCPGARFFWGGMGIAFAIGPVPRLLGELALLSGDELRARRHLEESIALCQGIGARPFLDLSIATLERCAAVRPAERHRGRITR